MKIILFCRSLVISDFYIYEDVLKYDPEGQIFYYGIRGARLSESTIVKFKKI